MAIQEYIKCTSAQSIVVPGTRNPNNISSQVGTFHETAAQEQKKYGSLISLDIKKLVLLFAVGSIAGLLIEIIYHAVVFGGYENRFGLVWGPFSPLYGAGAIALTVLLNRFWNRPGHLVFLVSALVGSAVEFACSWGMEYFFGAAAWDYSGTFMNIDGRVNLMFALMWGVLGLFWVRVAMPALDRGFDLVDWKNACIKASTLLLSVFLAVNIVVTVQALERESERASGIPATTHIDQFFDEHFPSEWMQNRFENMSINGASYR